MAGLVDLFVIGGDPVDVVIDGHLVDRPAARFRAAG